MGNETQDNTFTLDCGEDKLSADSWGSIAQILSLATRFPGDNVLQFLFADGTLIVCPQVKVDSSEQFVAAYLSEPLPAWVHNGTAETRYAQLGRMDYSDYLKTAEWDAIKRRKRRQSGNRCQVCNASGVQLDVHHRFYGNRGHELDEDLIVLCHECHGIFEKAGKLKREDDY